MDLIEGLRELSSQVDDEKVSHHLTAISLSAPFIILKEGKVTWAMVRIFAWSPVLVSCILIFTHSFTKISFPYFFCQSLKSTRPSLLFLISSRLVSSFSNNWHPRFLSKHQLIYTHQRLTWSVHPVKAPMQDDPTHRHPPRRAALFSKFQVNTLSFAFWLRLMHWSHL